MTEEKIEILTEDFSETFRSFFIKLKSTYKVAFENLEYSKPLYEVMKYLRYHGKSKMTDLVKELMVTKPYITSIADKLISCNLIYREHDVSDRRVILIDLTEKGHKIVKEYDLIMKNKIKENMSFFNDDEAKEFETMLSSMKKLMDSKFFNNI